LYTGGASNIVLNAGCITRYALKEYSSKATHLDIITKYVIGRSGIIGLQFHQENLSIGFSYDFPVIAKNVANTGAIEVGVELRRLVTPKKRNKRTKLPTGSQSDRKVVERKGSENKTPVNQQKKILNQKTSDTLAVTSKPGEDIGVRLKHKQDSVRADAEAGKFQHEPLVLEKATLHFNFEFNSTELNEETKRYLNDLARALIDNPDLRIQLIGHTDNIGSEKFNLKLSFYRAQQLKGYLVERGVATSRILVDGKGLKEPLNDNRSDEERALNRRVELTILYEQ
jgi:outer membrane protein OmpA-like peptidoglycan-associated protein